jgi:hypothetical protein
VHALGAMQIAAKRLGVHCSVTLRPSALERYTASSMRRLAR